MAKKAGFGDRIIATAKEIHETLIVKSKQKLEEQQQQHKEDLVVFELCEQIMNLKNSTLPEDAIRDYLRNLQSEFANRLPHV